MRIISILTALVLVFLCAACSPLTLDTEPETEPTGTVSTESSVPPDALPTISAGNAETLISNLLTEINLSGTIQPTDAPVAPGILPEVSRIPLADQSLVGKTVTVNLGSNQPAGSLLFHIDQQTGKGKLATVLHANQAFYIPLLVVLETDLDYSALCQALANGTDFTATVLSATNISFEEGMYTACNLDADQLYYDEEIDVKADSSPYVPGTRLLGRFGGHEAPRLYKYNIAVSATSSQLLSTLQAFSKVFTRFNINF